MKRIIGLFAVVVLLLLTGSVVAQNVCSNPKCHGGKIYCDDCDYTGVLNGKTCPKCNGAGSYPCPNCSGKGSIENGSNSNNNISNSNNSSASHEYSCPECKGEKVVPIRCTNPKCHNGAIYCEACDYKGTISQSCSVCDGKGEITKEKTKPCTECGGKGYSLKEKQEKCTCRNGKVPGKSRSQLNKGNTVWVDHAECKGTGYITSTYKATCRACGGDGIQKKKQVGANGHSVYTRENDVEIAKVKCDACNGKGKVENTCPKCNGKGCYPCPTCEGYGNIRKPCSRCKGRGVIYAK